MTIDILKTLFINLLCGSLLTFLLSKFYTYCWWGPSFFNMDWIEGFTRKKEGYPFYQYVLCILGVVTSFTVQFLLPAGCLIIKKLLSSQISIADSVIICSVPVVYLLAETLRWAWIDYTSGREMTVPIYLGSSTSPSSIERMKEQLIELQGDVTTEEIKNQETEVIGYVFKYRKKKTKSLSIIEDVNSFLFVLGGYLVICLIGGLLGYWLLQI